MDKPKVITNTEARRSTTTVPEMSKKESKRSEKQENKNEQLNLLEMATEKYKKSNRRWSVVFASICVIETVILIIIFYHASLQI